ncbi:MAG TPA: Tol-Pal system beta propeller repeat protein TolB [Desulfobulbus sp.]|nr:Tol-Pal system beta propeller repeat protein TolB [Desulfobulbus sp.]
MWSRHFSARVLVPVLACLLLLAGLPARRADAERVYLDITASEVRKVVVAVPAFVDKKGSDATGRRGLRMAELLGRALDFHGFVRVLDPARYGGLQDADWKKLQADYVVRGSYELDGNRLTVEGRLYDVAEDRLLAGRRYRGLARQQDDMVLRFADALVEEFTGEPGISRTSIAYVSDDTGYKEIYISDVLGRTRRQVTRHRHLCVSPRFTPDGNFLAYTTYHHGNQDLYITDLRQNRITRPLSRRKGMNLAPAFSPDGKTMVLTLSKDGNPDLYLLDRRGRILGRLTRGEGINVSPSFSPDGKSLVFVSDRSGRPQLYIMDMASRKVRRLTFQGVENSEPSWSPKGDRIAYTSLVDGHYQIFTIDPAGGTPRQVTTAWGKYESPTWSPDGRQIAFSRSRNGHSEICAALANGKDLRVLFKLKGNQSYPQWSPRPR